MFRSVIQNGQFYQSIHILHRLPTTLRVNGCSARFSSKCLLGLISLPLLTMVQITIKGYGTIHIK